MALNVSPFFTVYLIVFPDSWPERAEGLELNTLKSLSTFWPVAGTSSICPVTLCCFSDRPLMDRNVAGDKPKRVASPFIGSPFLLL